MHRFIVAILLLAAPHGAFASPGALFADPDFFTLGPGIGMGISDDTGALGDEPYEHYTTYHFNEESLKLTERSFP